MATAKDLFRDRMIGTIFSVNPDASIQEACLLGEHNVGALLVMEKEEGEWILFERDIVRKVGLQGKSADETKVQDVMTTKVLYVEADQTC